MLRGMRQVLYVSSTLLAASLVSMIAVGACGGDDSSGGAASSDASDEVALLCDTFTGSGTPCATVSTQVCFAMCVTGGCKCVAGANGGVWKCTVDESCYADAPDLSPDPDGGNPTPDGGADGASDAGDGANDAGDGASYDASDASDAGDASDGS